MPRSLATAIVNHIASLRSKKKVFFFCSHRRSSLFFQEGGALLGHERLFSHPSVAYGVYQLKESSDSSFYSIET